VFEACDELIEQKTTAFILNEENFPMSRLDVVLTFNEIRSETMEMFSEVLKMAYTK